MNQTINDGCYCEDASDYAHYFYKKLMPLGVLWNGEDGDWVGFVSEEDHRCWWKDNFIHSSSIEVVFCWIFTPSVEFIIFDNIQEVCIGDSQEVFSNLFLWLKFVESFRSPGFNFPEVHLMDDMAHIYHLMGLPWIICLLLYPPSLRNSCITSPYPWQEKWKLPGTRSISNHPIILHPLSDLNYV